MSKNRSIVKSRLLGRRLTQNYLLTGRIGGGGSGVVHRAIDLSQRRRVAVKMLRAKRSEAETARFAREAEHVRRLNHPNICRIIDFGFAADETPFLVMELLSGRTLSAWLQEAAPIPTVSALHVIRQVLFALKAAHEMNIVHRDIKPSNIQVLQSDDADSILIKLFDFGALKIVGQRSYTDDNIVLGSPHYLAPEQALDAQIDHRVDIYATGVVLYEILTGQRPYTNPDRQKLVADIACSRPFAPPTALNKDLSRQVEMIILKAMARNRADRYGSADEMREDVDDILFGNGSVDRHTDEFSFKTSPYLPTYKR